jgi:hypothetical protein
VATTRYNDYWEAKVVATRKWERGEVIESFTGILVALTPDQVEGLSSQFSVLSKKSQDWLLLSVLRYVNHDCQPNCEVGIYWCLFSMAVAHCFCCTI